MNLLLADSLLNDPLTILLWIVVAIVVIAVVVWALRLLGIIR